ncbi:MAG: hypothetical protein OQK69_05500 [Gammaproteobacteria bacterium]|nr:hypothetical protein [Gammaproteobacteria bacterium]
MEENEYRAKYREIAINHCAFEKALTNNQCRCQLSQHFWLADREGYTCKSPEMASKCHEILAKIRENSRFVLKMHEVDAPLPHNMEIRVQVGGLRGLRAVLGSDETGLLISDIRSLIEQAEQQFENMDALPYSEIVQSIASFQTRRHGKSKRSRDTD